MNSNERKVLLPSFLLLTLAWTLFVQSALKQSALSFGTALLWTRVLLAAAGFVMTIVSAVRPMRAALTIYLTACMLAQAVFGALEPPGQIEFYQYVTYFLLMAALSHSGSLKSWAIRYAAPQALAVVGPLFFKSSEHFQSVGNFAYVYTTPIALVFMSAIVLRLGWSKHEALLQNLTLRDELLQMTRGLNMRLEVELSRTRTKLEEQARLAGASELAHRVAHDIRSPIGALKAARGLLKSVDHQAVRDSLEILELSVLSLERISESALENRKSAIDLEPIGLAVSRAVDLTSAAHPQAILWQEVGPEVLQVQVPGLTRALGNLLKNAIEATPGLAKPIRVSARAATEGADVLIEIADQGAGIPPAVLESLRGGTPVTTKADGNGIGVSSLMSWAREAGVKVDIRSSTEIGSSGTTVSLRVCR